MYRAPEKNPPTILDAYRRGKFSINKAKRKKLKLNPTSPTRISLLRPVLSDSAPQSGAVKKEASA